MLISLDHLNEVLPEKFPLLLKGTCGGCKSFPIESREQDIGKVKCTNPESPFHNSTPGLVNIGCLKIENKTRAPEGFNLM